jgi:hypothetical protein
MAELWRLLVSDNGEVPFSVEKDDLEGYADGIVRQYTARIMIVFCTDTDEVWDIYKTESADNGESWSAPVKLVSDIAECTPSIVQDSKGVLWIYYVRTVDDEDKLYRIKSEDDGLSWSEEEAVPEEE